MTRELKPGVRSALHFFKQAGLERVLEQAWQKYREQSGIAGTIILKESTLREREGIDSLLARPLTSEGTLKISMQKLDQVLQGSGFRCTLLELLLAFFPQRQMVTRQEERERQQSGQERFRQRLEGIAVASPQSLAGRDWLLRGRYGLDWLYRRYKRISEQPEESWNQDIENIASVATALNRLPGRGEYQRLGLFAQACTGDPHAFDPNREAGRLLIYALVDHLLLKEQKAREIPQKREEHIHLYSEVGLLIDGISSNVAVAGLVSASFRAGQEDRWLAAADGRIVILPLRQLVDWSGCRANEERIYIIENPQVFEELVDQPWGERRPTIVCTAGWPGAAAYRLLDLLEAEEKEFWYSGDHDLKGMQIAATLLKRYKRARAWRFDIDSYQHALRVGGVPASEQELGALERLPHEFKEIVESIQQHQKWAYQEGIVNLLKQDIAVET